MGLSTSYTILVATVMIVQCNKDRGRQPCQRVYLFKILDSIVLYNACAHINIHYVLNQMPCQLCFFVLTPAPPNPRLYVTPTRKGNVQAVSELVRKYPSQWKRKERHMRKERDLGYFYSSQVSCNL